jgi:hypothetical protein
LSVALWRPFSKLSLLYQTRVLLGHQVINREGAAVSTIDIHYPRHAAFHVRQSRHRVGETPRSVNYMSEPDPKASIPREKLRRWRWAVAALALIVPSAGLAFSTLRKPLASVAAVRIASKKIIPGPFDFRESADDRFVLRALQDLGLEGYWSASPPRVR